MKCQEILITIMSIESKTREKGALTVAMMMHQKITQTISTKKKNKNNRKMNS